MTSYKSLKFLKVENVGDFVYKVTLNRPEKYNALNLEIWGEIGDCFKLIHDDPDCRVVILQGEGKHFCTGLDMSSGSVLGMGSSDEQDQARKSRATRRNVEWMQRQFTYVDDCSKPVLLAIHGYCMGAGVDLATACDIRYASKDAVFSVKEVDVGMAADIGTLNRLPKIVGNQSWVKDISLSARNFPAGEAFQFGFLSRVFENREEMLTEVSKFAKLLALKSPIAVQGTKHILNYSRDHNVHDSLTYVATWNMSQLLTEDVFKAGLASMSKKPPPPFSKL